MRREDWTGVAAAIGLTAAAAVIGGATGDFRSRWYQDLRKPSWQPSGRTIGTVWSVLYPMIGVAGAMLWTRRRSPGGRGAAALFLAQLALNAAWTPLFTRARRLRLATAECLALTAINAALVARAGRVRPAAAALLAPYAAWTAFATVLSGTVAWLNR